MNSTSQTSTTTIIALILGLIVLVPLLTMGGGMMGGGIGMLGGGMFLWPLLLIGLVFLIFYGVVGESEPTTEDEALKTLRSRYARDEITDEEFEERRRTLQSQQDSRRRS